jgi:hypothetical protein
VTDAGSLNSDVTIKTRLNIDMKRRVDLKMGPDVHIQGVCSGLSRSANSDQQATGAHHGENGPDHHSFLGSSIATGTGLVASAMEQVHEGICHPGPCPDGLSGSRFSHG